MKNKFQEKILGWVTKMQTGPAQFKMSEEVNGSIFSTCFALFIFDLFSEVNKWPQKEKDIWIDYINSFQDKNTGYFIPKSFNGNLNSKPVYQLTCFCLSALDILEATPKYRLHFLNQWQKEEDIYKYLNANGCLKGEPGSGNMAMFLGIFLTYKYEKYKDQSAIKLIEKWFEYHNLTQNKKTGFWNRSTQKIYYEGFQNAFHQFVLYNYWSRTIPYFSNIIDCILSIQDCDGHFGIVPGGGGCWDYDAADILINCGYRNGYRKEDIQNALTRLFYAILSNQNEDGGFCESKKKLGSINDFLKPYIIKFIFYNIKPYLWYHRFKSIVSVSIKTKERIFNHWTEKGWLKHKSDMWNTWIKCLTLAEISRTIKVNHPIEEINWKFHKMVGLGFFKVFDQGK